MKISLAGIAVPGVLAVVGIGLLVFWAGTGPVTPLEARVPGLDRAPPPGPAKVAARPTVGEPVLSSGKPAEIPGVWPWFRGINHDAILSDGVRLARRWPEGGPKRLWSLELGEGYAAAAISAGRVYVLDHVHDAAIDLLRGLSPKDRNVLAAALSSLSPGSAADLDEILRGLFPGQAAGEGRRSLSPAEHDQLKQALLELLSQQPGKLFHALRSGALDDIDRSADTMRCLSLADGRELWHNSYPVVVPSYHGISRTIPAVIGNYVVSLGPQCHVVCWDAQTGKPHWPLLDLVLDYGATVPPWYTGQCPLIDAKTDQLLLAPGGKALVIAVDYRTGKVKWESPNPRGWSMTHVSIMPMEFAGRRMYVYCGKGGVAGVAAESGEILWDTTDWQIGMATCPSPVVIGQQGKIFLCGGYNAGAMMLQIKEQGGRFTAQTLFRLLPKQFSSVQQTPILFDGRLYGVRQTDQQLVCLNLEGNELWNSGKDKFGSAPYLIADGLILAMNDEGWLTLAEATPGGYKPLSRAQVIEDGVTCWGPMALAAGRLIVRDLTRMVCLDVAAE
jgi:outer membrane protein assembly factor BamB